MKASFSYSFQYLGIGEKRLPLMPPVAPEHFEPDTALRSMDRGFELLERADQLGFDWISMSEHHYSPRQLTANPMLFAAAATKVVKRAKIAILGPTIPLLNPVRVAEEYAMLDLLSGGRAIMALLRGTAPEYTTYWANPAESRERYEEGVELILSALSEPQPFGWEGRHYRFRTVSIWPRPVQDPPAIYCSGNSPESGSLAAKHRLGMGLSLNPLPTVRKLTQHYREECAREGWAPCPDQVVYRGSMVVADTDAEAIELATTYRIGAPGGGTPSNTVVRDAIAATGKAGPTTSLLANPEERYAGGATFCGSPSTVLEQLREFHAAGVGVVDLLFGGGSVPQAITERSIELFAREVLPCIRAW
jgi:alkanesulfonate monooxygenase SsuD/methylene tetrahydromethanopterin reductase-like flavin-dependent oxidoreductase (luciferase family)